MSDAGDLVAGRYRLLQRVGSGAMGVVWRARDERLQRQVAVKQLLLQTGLDPARADEARRRAMREGRVAARLHHPNAIGVYDVVVDDGLPVLVMEYLPSRSLAEILAERGPLPPATAAQVGAQAASALAAAHAAGVVHRDVKPGNILIAEDGTAKITDFGISHATGDVAITQTGLVAGTPAYLAPEVARGHRPTAGSDIFSLGATLYAAVEGAPPFGGSGENSLALLHKVAAGDVPPPQQAGPLAPVLGSMLRTDPEERLTAVQAGEALLAVASGRPVPASAVAASGERHTRPLTPIAAATMPLAPATQGQTKVLADGPSGSRGPDRTMMAPGPPTEEGAAQRRRLPYLLAGLVVAVLAGIGLYALLGANDDPQRPATVSMAPAALERAVSDYYDLLPDEAEKAWERLGPELRTQGKQRYLDRWSGVAAVRVVSTPRATGDDTVHVGIELSMPDGSKVTQFHQLTLLATERTLLINGDELLHSETEAPPPPAPEPTQQQDENTKEEKPKEEEQKKADENKNEDGENGQGGGEETTVEETEVPPTEAPTEGGEPTADQNQPGADG